MKKNVGTIDRILRIVIGLGLLSLTIVGPKTLWGLVGIIPMLTALFNFCPAYLMIGQSTCGLKEPK